MTPVLWFGFIIGGAGLIFFIVIILRTSIKPKRLQLIEGLIESGNVKAAMRQAKMLLARSERNVDAHWFLGESYRAENRPELAVVEYKYITNALRFTQFATERKVRERLGEAYLELGQVDEAQKEFILLSKIEPNNHEIIYKIARLFEDRDYSDSALANYKKAIDLNPHHASSHYRLGLMYFKRNAFNEARQELLTAIKLDPNNYAPHYYMGKISRMNGDRVKALEQFERALRDSELRQRAYLERANIFVMEKEYQQAISELEKGIKVGEKDLPATLAVRYLLSRCYEMVNDLGKALEQWEWIYERNPKYADVAVKLSTYGGLRADDNLKDFLIAPLEKFAEYCENLAALMGMKVHQKISGDNDIYEYMAYEADQKIRRMGSGLCIVRVVRTPDPLGYEAIRGLYDQMRKMNAMRSVCITASKFTKNAVEFAQSRPIDLIDKEELTKLLQNISL
jgi:tetratricopeptide (TPR) repeat protein